MKAAQLRQAMDALAKIQTAEPACDPEEYHLYAIAALNVDDTTGALSSIDKAIRIFPGFVPLQEYYVSLLSRAVSAQDASVKLEAALRISPQSHIYRKELGRVLLSLNAESARAGTLLADAVAERPEDAESRLLYAEWLFTAHRQNEAEKHVDYVLAQLSANGLSKIEAYRLKAALEEQAGNPAAAREAYERAIEWNDQSAKPQVSARWEYAQFLIRQAQDTTARAVLEKITKQFPSFGAAHLALAKLYARDRSYETAIKEAQTALQCSATSDEQRSIHTFLSKTYYAAGLQRQATIEEQWVESH